MSTKSVLVALFEQGDVPQGTNFADLINSSVNLNETTVQTMLGPLNPTEIITARVSATNVIVTGTLSVAGITSAGAMNVSTLITNTVSADAIYASAVRTTGGFYGGSAVVSALGTAQATAAPLVNFINRGKGIVDGTTTGFAIPANRTGWFQFLLNEGVSANLWPPIGGFINGLAANAPFPLATSASYTIFHISASAYGVK